MPKRSKAGRPSFGDWIDRQPDPGWDLMPLTHLTKALLAEDIIRDSAIQPQDRDDGEPLAYFFYGRPAYRAGGGDVVKLEAACPYCFIFKKELLEQAAGIHAFDTGAFGARLYSHVLVDEMNVEDFSLGTDTSRPNKLISAAFSTQESYFDGSRSKVIDPEEGAKSWEMLGRAYLELLRSPGRNEPDDRICSIEVQFGSQVALEGNLLAVVVPHTHWDNNERAPWLEELSARGVQVIPYNFVPGRHPEQYHALLEAAVRDLYKTWQVI